MDAILTLIHRWNLPQFLYNWQTLIAGVLALLAAGITVWVTLRVERGKARREVDALRKSLGVELRVQINRALSVYDGLRKLSRRPGGPIIASMVESESRMPAPIIYLANAGKSGLLEDDAMDVVLIYAMLEGARGRVDAMLEGAQAHSDRLAPRYDIPENIDRDAVMSIAKAFLGACDYAREVLPRLRTGAASYDAQDEALIQKINAALAAHQT